jgi:rhomboid family GlyGly-CTERM serine protease
MKPVLLITALFVAPAIWVHCAPETVRTALLYNRDALAEGQLWRLITAHWVHFGLAHLIANLAALTAIGVSLERLRSGTLIRFTLISALGISALVWWLEPAMIAYGGLSGMVFGGATLLVLLNLRTSRHALARLRWSVALLLLVAKAIADVNAWSLTPNVFPSTSAVQVSAWAHAAGAMIAAGYFLVLSIRAEVTLRPSLPRQSAA